MEYYFNKLKATPILIGAHCGPPFTEGKISHLFKLVTELKNKNYFIILVNNSKIPREIIDLCDVYFENFNYTNPGYGVSVSMQTEIGLNIAKYHLYNKCLRIEYDSPINYDYDELIFRCQTICKENNKKFVSAEWGTNGIGTGNFYIDDIDFLLKNVRFFSFKTGHDSFYGIVEIPFKEDLLKSGAINQSYIYKDYHEYYKCKNTQKYQGGGTIELY
jgi:hypothetical protein